MVSDVRDLQIAEEDIRGFLEAVARRLQVARSRVAYGKDESEHVFFTAARDAEEADLQHVVVVIVVQRSQGRSRALLRQIRQPNEPEWTELGVAPQALWSEELADRLAELFTREVLAAKEEIGRDMPAIFRRFHLSFESIRGVAGEYWVGPWRLGPPISPPDRAGFGEKILLCDRLLPGEDLMAARQEVERLGLLLSVFWLYRFRTIPSTHVWVFDEFVPGQDLTGRLAQRGYADCSRTHAMPAPGELSPAGTYREVDRLDSFRWAIVAGEPFLPPSDSPLLFERFYGADADVAERFLAACKTYDTAMRLVEANVTGAISYLVVAAESLIETELERCEHCHQFKGVSRAARDLFFELLPCLEAQRVETERFLKHVYTIRSCHFHDADFVAGEIEPWYQTEFLLPAPLDATTTFNRLWGLVNGVLVAWLMRETGEPWHRATQTPPRIREPNYFSVSVRLAGC